MLGSHAFDSVIFVALTFDEVPLLTNFFVVVVVIIIFLRYLIVAISNDVNKNDYLLSYRCRCRCRILDYRDVGAGWAQWAGAHPPFTEKMKWVKCPPTFSYHNDNIILYRKTGNSIQKSLK